jgi:hypothetical protein
MRTVRVGGARQVAHALILLTVIGVAGCSSQSSTGAGDREHSVSTPSTSIPAATGHGLLYSVSCGPSGTCLAVGDAPSSSVTLIRVGSSSHWSTGTQGYLGGNSLGGAEVVSCVGPGVCLMMGGITNPNTAGGPASFTSTGFQVGAGRSWRRLPSLPMRPIDGLQLTAPTQLSCTSVKFCVAVGSAAFNQATTGLHEAVIQMWTGQGWATPLIPVMRPAASYYQNQLEGVSCVGPTFCMAVGFQQAGSITAALAERWDGSQWKEMTMPPVSGSELESVSCTSSSFCLALGGADRPGDLVETWNGQSWSLAAYPQPFGHYPWMPISSLACTSPTRCLAVWSSAIDGSAPQWAFVSAVSQLWNGSNWTDVVMPNPSLGSAQINLISGVSCTDRDDCVAVGRTMGEGEQTMLIESWNGAAWMEDPPPARDPVEMDVRRLSSRPHVPVWGTS